MFSINKAMGMVPNASEHGFFIDQMLEIIHWFMALLFVGWSFYFVYTLWRFHRSRNPKADYHGVHSKASAHLEFTVVVIEAMLLLGFAFPIWAKRVNGTAYLNNASALRVRAVGEQFFWNFHYPGADGVFGKANIAFVSGTNPLGLDPNDPAGKDDIVTKNEIHLVDHRPVVIEITSKDVIHSFALKHMRMMQDAIPGSKVPIWFKPIRTGEFEIVCAQLCGTGHYAMRSVMKVESQADFDAWMKETNDLQHPAKAADASPAPAAVALAAH